MYQLYYVKDILYLNYVHVCGKAYFYNILEIFFYFFSAFTQQPITNWPFIKVYTQNLSFRSNTATILYYISVLNIYKKNLSSVCKLSIRQKHLTRVMKKYSHKAILQQRCEYEHYNAVHLYIIHTIIY